MEVDEKVEELDELDNWFGDSEEDQSAESDTEGGEESSASTYSADEGPDNEDPTTAASEEAPDDGNSAEPTTEGDDPYSWVESLDPEVRAKVEALKQTAQSSTGRVAALRSRLDKVEAERQAAGQSRSPGAPQEPEMDEDTKRRLEEFREDYPSVAEASQTLVDQAVKAAVAPLQEKLEVERAVAEREKLRAGVAEIFNSAETGIELEDLVASPQWKAWFADQPEAYQRYAMESRGAEDALKVVRDFAQYAEEQMWREHQANQPPPSPASPPQAEPSAADRVAARRTEALAGSTPASQSGEVAPVTSYEDDFNAAVGS